MEPISIYLSVFENAIDREFGIMNIWGVFKPNHDGYPS
jgi:hypothetical protein